jgi:hypothetical protein
MRGVWMAGVVVVLLVDHEPSVPTDDVIAEGIPRPSGDVR